MVTHERLEVHALLQALDNNYPEGVMLYDMHKSINVMKLRKSQGTEAITNG